MNMKFKLVAAFLVVCELVLIGLYLSGNANIQVFNPKGPVAREQRDLIVTAIGVMLIVAIPLLTAFYTFAFKYRAGDKKRVSQADGRHSARSQLVWWLIPAFFISILAIITWNKTHKLDPYKPLVSDVRPVRIQVIALQWKWLFLYPEYGIATVNYIRFPEKTPINFELTADAPMNSFWIPSLSGQVYAMTGMTTKLHVMADEVGEYPGVTTEISGRGFSRMKFVAKSSTSGDFESWIKNVKANSNNLTESAYNKLALPSENNPVYYFGSYDNNLYNKILQKFMSSEIHSEENNNHY